ncbi:DUF4357 domain-containing protein [Sangeribacter muris]|uniref:DUF4357 domain-containing protein n=1 Tax=Sangeribacter muris TaxID=2880703 RepID=UPI00244DA70F|nr:DUF4357 domain-containing protein [Sangeribacter muris]
MNFKFGHLKLQTCQDRSKFGWSFFSDRRQTHSKKQYRVSGKLTHNLSVEIKTQVNRHIFWITIFGRCKAYGYLDKESKNFYIGTDSLISTKDNNEYIATSSYRNRHRLIKNYGIPTNNYIKLKKDVKCRSAVAAARYVVGATVDLDLWKDASGRTLYDIYPEIFFR